MALPVCRQLGAELVLFSLVSWGHSWAESASPLLVSRATGNEWNQYTVQLCSGEGSENVCGGLISTKQI